MEIGKTSISMKSKAPFKNGMLFGVKTMKFLLMWLSKLEANRFMLFNLLEGENGEYFNHSGTRAIGIPSKVDIDNDALISHIVQHTLHTYYFYNFYYKTLISYPPYH